MDPTLHCHEARPSRSAAVRADQGDLQRLVAGGILGAILVAGEVPTEFSFVSTVAVRPRFPSSAPKAQITSLAPWARQPVPAQTEMQGVPASFIEASCSLKLSSSSAEANSPVARLSLW